MWSPLYAGWKAITWHKTNTFRHYKMDGMTVPLAFDPENVDKPYKDEEGSATGLLDTFAHPHCQMFIATSTDLEIVFGYVRDGKKIIGMVGGDIQEGMRKVENIYQQILDIHNEYHYELMIEALDKEKEINKSAEHAALIELADPSQNFFSQVAFLIAEKYKNISINTFAKRFKTELKRIMSMG